MIFNNEKASTQNGSDETQRSQSGHNRHGTLTWRKSVKETISFQKRIIQG
jgi:hypothetical protein